MAGSVVPNAAIAQFDAAGTLQVQILGALGPGHVAHAVAVNEFGMVAGNSRDPSGTQVAFVWTAATGMVGLGSLDGRVSVATDINDQGQIVGWSTSAGRFPQVAFVWQNGQMFDLNLITEGGGGKNWIQIASGINDQGHIVGLLTKTKPISEQHGLLLVPNSP
jgi:probable HAF family extracellular repeat protein